MMFARLVSLVAVVLVALRRAQEHAVQEQMAVPFTQLGWGVQRELAETEPTVSAGEEKMATIGESESDCDHSDEDGDEVDVSAAVDAGSTPADTDTDNAATAEVPDADTTSSVEPTDTKMKTSTTPNETNVGTTTGPPKPRQLGLPVQLQAFGFVSTLFDASSPFRIGDCFRRGMPQVRE